MNAHLPLACSLVLSITTQAQQPIARYLFDGNVMDISGNGYHGIVHADEMPYGTGYYGGFDLSLRLRHDAYIDLSALAAPFRQRMDAMTIAFFLKADGQPDEHIPEQTVLALGGPGESTSTNQFTLRFRGGRFELATESDATGPDHFVTLDTTLHCGQWHFLALTLDGPSLIYYRGGLPVLRTTYASTVSTSNRLFLGARAGLDADHACCFYTGQMDDLRVYDTVLDDGQVAALIGASVGITGPEGRSFTFGPNPANEVVDIRTDVPGTTLDVVDASGRIVQQHQALPPHVRLDVSNLPAGCYLLRMTTPAGVRSERLVVGH